MEGLKLHTQGKTWVPRIPTHNGVHYAFNDLLKGISTFLEQRNCHQNMLNYVCGANPEIRTGLFEESETDGMKQDVNDYVIEYTITTSKIGSDFLNVEPLSIEIDPGVTAEVISSLSKKARSAIGCALVYAHMQHKYEFESESTESHPLWQRPTVAKDHFRQQAEQIDRDLYEAIYNGAFGTYNSHPEFYDTDMLDGN